MPEGVPLSRSPPAVDKYLPDWTDRNYHSGHLAETERLAAERLLAETKDLIANAKYKTRQDEQEVDTRFKQRVGDIAFWKSELEAKLGDLKESIDAAESQHIRAEHALSATSEPLDIVEKCMAHRQQRQGVDLCNDNVSKHLELESATIKGVQEALKHTLRESSEEIRMLQKTKSEIEKDLLDKEAAMDIDEQTARLKITAPKKRTETGRTSNRYAAVSKAGKQPFTTEDWASFSERNLGLAKRAISNALQLQSSVDVILARNTANLKTQKDLTDRAFNRRIDEVKAAKELLEQQHSETIVKIGEMDDNIKSLEKAISAKQGPLATCQLKIQQRKARPNVELVVDDVERHLHAEAQNLVENINKLEMCLVKSKVSFAALQKSRLELEAQVGVKANSIYIDEVKCMTIRQSVQHQAF